MSPERAAFGYFARRSARRALPWGVISAVVVISSAVTYQAAYSTAGQRLALAASLEANVGLAALFGPARGLDTVWGFTAWRSIGLFTIVGGVWGVLSGARLLRGEEDAGRWDAVLAGATDRRRATAAALAGGLAGIVVVWLLTALGALVCGAIASVSTGAIFALATAIVAPAACTFCVTFLLAHLVGTRGAAARAGAVFFAASYLLRVVAIAAGPSALGWATPFGWVDRLHPLTGFEALPGMALLALCASAVAIGLWLADVRDVGSGIWHWRGRRRASLHLLGTPEGFSVRETFPALLGWAVGLAAVCTVLGLVSRSVAEIATQSAVFRGLAGRLGGVTVGSRIFLGLAMTIVISAVALAAAGFAAAVHSAESGGFLEAIVGTRTSRTRWLLARSLTAVLALVILGTVIGLALWVATRATGTPIAFATLANAGANVVPAAVLVLGLGMLAFGAAPRFTAAVAYGLVVWSFLVELIGALAKAPSWLMNLSVLHHVAAAPAVAPRWGTNLILIAVGVLAAAGGTAAFARRDIAG